MMVSDVLGNYDERAIITPISSDVFKVQGGGDKILFMVEVHPRRL